MASNIRGEIVYCGAGASLSNGVMAIFTSGGDGKKRIVTLNSSGGIGSFLFNGSVDSEVPFVADDFGTRVAAKALEGTAIGQYIIEIASIQNGVRVRLSDGRAFDIIEVKGEMKKVNETDHCLRVTSHGFYTFYDKKFYKSADGTSGGLVPLADGDILYVIESGDTDYKVYLRDENGTPVVYFENTKITGVYSGMPIFAYSDNGTRVYFSDGKLVNINLGSSIDVDMAGWIDIERTLALHAFSARDGSNPSLDGAAPPAQKAWLNDHGHWAESSWAGIGLLGSVLPTPQPNIFRYSSQVSWQYSPLRGGFYVANGKMHIGDVEIDVTSATGSALMQLVETIDAPIYSFGGVTEKVDAGEIINYGIGYAGNRWKQLSPTDFFPSSSGTAVAI